VLPTDNTSSPVTIINRKHLDYYSFKRNKKPLLNGLENNPQINWQENNYQKKWTKKNLQIKKFTRMSFQFPNNKIHTIKDY
jgi:hypothetical protein